MVKNVLVLGAVSYKFGFINYIPLQPEYESIVTSLDNINISSIFKEERVDYTVDVVTFAEAKILRKKYCYFGMETESGYPPKTKLFSSCESFWSKQKLPQTWFSVVSLFRNITGEEDFDHEKEFDNNWTRTFFSTVLFKLNKNDSGESQ